MSFHLSALNLSRMCSLHRYPNLNRCPCDRDKEQFALKFAVVQKTQTQLLLVQENKRDTPRPELELVETCVRQSASIRKKLEDSFSSPWSELFSAR